MGIERVFKYNEYSTTGRRTTDPVSSALLIQPAGDNGVIHGKAF